MAKPIYYLWIHKDTNIDELEKEKQKYLRAGFRIALIDDTSDNDFDESLVNLIKTHLEK